MKGNFARSLAAVLEHEGGYVNHPRDPGGATNLGVTQDVYNDFRKSRGLDLRSVKFIGGNEVGTIYRDQYWNAVKAPELPAGVDYCIFDFAVNSGPTRAAKFLQRAVGVADDGKIGPVTLAAVNARSAKEVIAEVCEARLRWLQTLPHFPTFGRGWTKRVDGVRALAESMT
jgi:lysozyme family protein